MNNTMKALVMVAVILALGAGSALAQCVDALNGVQVVQLLAGQTTDAGEVAAEVVGNDLQITFSTTNGWELTEAHLWVGGSLADMPQTNKGNPKIGNFPYNSGNISGAIEHTFSVPLTNLGFSCPGDDQDFYVAAHAALRKPNGSGGYQTETGWGSGTRFVSKGSWATFFMTTLTCDCGNTGGGGGGSCETAFAFGDATATCFIGADFDGDGADDGFKRWGWSSGPLGPGYYEFEIYAAAGQCDLSKGIHVGYLAVDYDGATATVTFNTNSGFTMDETHLYVGNEPLATNNGEFTVAPGQHPYIKELSEAISDQYVVSVSGDIYVVAHSVVCGAY